MDKKTKQLVARELVKIAKSLVGGAERDYLFLGRMQQDFEYALNERTPAYGSEKHLMMLNFEDQIKEMKKLWNRVDEKPKWLTKRDIADYEKKIKKLRRSKVSKSLLAYTIKDFKTPQASSGNVKMLSKLIPSVRKSQKALRHLSQFEGRDMFVHVQYFENDDFLIHETQYWLRREDVGVSHISLRVSGKTVAQALVFTDDFNSERKKLGKMRHKS